MRTCLAQATTPAGLCPRTEGGVHCGRSFAANGILSRALQTHISPISSRLAKIISFSGRTTGRRHWSRKGAHLAAPHNKTSFMSATCHLARCLQAGPMGEVNLCA
jgi:hypothetical protein